METFQVEFPERSYPILIGPDLLAHKALFEQHVSARDVLLVSNTTVAPLYGGQVVKALQPRRVVEVLLPDGEVHKTLPNVARILDVLVANAFARDCAIVALGGGVVGDMAGFAAACYQRGVSCIHAPTTLLAQVDSSVGGKTGVNHAGGKNLIGAFHQPVAVIADTATLATLPERELRAGLAEVVKYGLICDADFFAWLESNIETLLARQAGALTYAIRRSCEIKAAIVKRDEREQGDRALLNLGHTFAHAIESATGYRAWLHGEAVGAGLMMAATMSNEAGMLAAADLARVRALLERAGFTLAARDVAGADAIAYMRIDKKVRAGRLRFVLLRRIGDAYVTVDYPDGALKRTLDLHFA
ncbi:MAG: 3-dehydroquinate synthase [Gammaproteobacteria bacterium]